MHRFGPTITTREALTEVGYRLRQYRLQQNRMRKQVASDAGISIRTLQRAEEGNNPTLETVIRILRALGRLDNLESLLPPPLISPLQLADLGGRERQRARGPRRKPEEGQRDAKADDA